MSDENKEKNNDNMRLKSKPRFEGLDGLRGVAAITVVIFHIFELFSEGPAYQIINHGYLAVDFFYALSGFVISYAYDDRWNKMSLWDFYKRRLIRLHPLVIAGTCVGVCYYFLGECDTFPNIENVKPYAFFVTILLNILMIPTPKNFDIRGWGTTNAFDDTTWTLTYEYLINILYSLIIRRLNNIIISILTILSALLTINLTMDFDLFKVFVNRDSRRYTVIGGWEISSCEVYIAFARLLYPFFSGYLISRLKLKIKLPYSFIICSIILLIILSCPRITDESKWFTNGIYETIVIIILFPIILLIGAGDTEQNEKIIKICKFLGDFSYPLYITHIPLIYCLYAWKYFHKDDQKFNAISVSVGSFLIMIFNAYSLIKLYDEPVRKWLSEKYLIKKKKEEEKEKENNNINENPPKDDIKEKFKIIDESSNDIEDESKSNKLLDENIVNES